MYFIFVTVWLSVPVQLIAWKETRLRNDHVEWNVKPYTLTHSLSREKLTAYSANRHTEYNALKQSNYTQRTNRWHHW